MQKRKKTPKQIVNGWLTKKTYNFVEVHGGQHKY